jgi:6-pyruvoyltetrahydropterin/6-carboxytetrahydropterin synthase
MARITRKLEFDSMHRVVGHEGKCAELHGHRYTTHITVRSVELDSIGRAVDFGVIKKRIGGWIDDNLDHTSILNSKDPLLKWLSIADAQTTRYSVEGRSVASKPVSSEVFGKRGPYILPCLNPTAEVLCQVLFLKCIELLGDIPGLSVYKVRLYETPNSYADHFERDPIHESLLQSRNTK